MGDKRTENQSPTLHLSTGVGDYIDTPRRGHGKTERRQALQRPLSAERRGKLKSGYHPHPLDLNPESSEDDQSSRVADSCCDEPSISTKDGANEGTQWNALEGAVEPEVPSSSTVASRSSHTVTRTSPCNQRYRLFGTELSIDSPSETRPVSSANFVGSLDEDPPLWTEATTQSPYYRAVSAESILSPPRSSGGDSHRSGSTPGTETEATDDVGLHMANVYSVDVVAASAVIIVLEDGL